MTDLTEYTWYYCKMKDGDIRMLERGIDYFLAGDVPLLNNEVKEVLAPVPSYEELVKLKEELKDFEYEHKQYAMSYEDTFCKLETARKENKQLKELLKQARGLMNTTKDWACTEATENMIAKIDKALGEDK